MDIPYQPATNQTQAASTHTPEADSEDSLRIDGVLVEEFRLSSEVLIDAIRDMIGQSSIRRIIVQNEEGNSLLQIPMMVGVASNLVGIDLSCELASLGIIAAIVKWPHIVVERKA